MGTVTIGVDIGQRHDPTAIAVMEAEIRTNASGRTETHYIARHLERLPLMTPYPKAAERIALVVMATEEKSGYRPELYIDATGVGTPVVDVLRAAGVMGRLIPVYFTHGDRRTVEASGEVKLGKAWLVSRLQALLQSRLLHLPRTAEADALGRELLDYEIKIDENANDKYGAFKVGAHDDLVTAVGLATQKEPLPLPFGWIELPDGPSEMVRWQD